MEALSKELKIELADNGVIIREREHGDDAGAPTVTVEKYERGEDGFFHAEADDGVIRTFGQLLWRDIIALTDAGNAEAATVDVTITVL